jgi:hypothetical protein
VTANQSDWCPAAWNVLHDAIIVAISGAVPGQLDLTLDCDYLRDRIDHPGNHFYMTLSGCTRFGYRPWNDDTVVIEDLQLIERRRLWILRADVTSEFCKVHCNEHIPHGNGGVLEVVAAEVRVTLDGTRPITQPELESVAEEYWSEWGASTKDLESRDDK